VIEGHIDFDRIFFLKRTKFLEDEQPIACLWFEDMSKMSKKNKNTQIAQKKAQQREKEAKKKSMLSQLPPKGKKK
jgi:hypothetical protein